MHYFYMVYFVNLFNNAVFWDEVKQKKICPV
jgi:hypothetical protein